MSNEPDGLGTADRSRRIADMLFGVLLIALGASSLAESWPVGEHLKGALKGAGLLVMGIFFALPRRSALVWVPLFLVAMALFVAWFICTVA